MRYSVRDEDGHTVVDVWMDGTSYIDDAVTKVRKDVEAKAREHTRPVSITIAAVLECFNVELSAGTERTYHQSVAKTD
jgi:hypothetical protein